MLKNQVTPACVKKLCCFLNLYVTINIIHDILHDCSLNPYHTLTFNMVRSRSTKLPVHNF